jgi:transcriptional regulator with XRE-family HTH domain
VSEVDVEPVDADDSSDSHAGESVINTRELLAARIRELRQARGMSITALAKQAGITGAMVSQVERGVTNPSVATVARIATVLGVSVAEIFQVEHPKEMVVRPGDRRKIVYPNADIVDEIISSDPTHQLLVLECRIGPMQGSETQMPSLGAAVEFVLVISGTLEITVGGQTYVLNDRDTLTFDGRQQHTFFNHTDTDVRLIWVTSPATY